MPLSTLPPSSTPLFVSAPAGASCMTTVINLGEIRAERHAAAVVTAVLANLATIQNRLIGYFHVDAGNSPSRYRARRRGLAVRLGRGA